MKKAYFQYYESFEKIVQKFETAEERENFRGKIIDYGLYGQEPEDLNEREEFVWDIVRDMIDDQMHRRQVNKENREARDKKQSEKNQPTETEPEEKEPVKQKRFVPPTPEEVQAYCQDRGNSVNAEKFCSYYAAQGWKVGNHAMKDWKAAVRTWEQNQKTRPVYGAYGTAPPPTEWPEDKLQL